MDARYIQATTVLPRQDKVCGRTLLPFCLRHRICLEAIDSPFLNPLDRVFKPHDIILAARIISTYDKAKMGGDFSIKEKWHMARLMLSNKLMQRCIGIILGVIKTSCSYPKLWEKETKTKKHEKLPWILACVSNNVRNGCTLEEAWTMPEGEAVWLSISHAIFNGAKIDIVSTDDEVMMDNFKDIIAKFKKENNLP